MDLGRLPQGCFVACACICRSLGSATRPGHADAGVPENVVFATKPHLAATMITDAVQAGTPARWVAGDEVYGADPHLRATCRRLGLGYVLVMSWTPRRW